MKKGNYAHGRSTLPEAIRGIITYNQSIVWENYRTRFNSKDRIATGIDKTSTQDKFNESHPIDLDLNNYVLTKVDENNWTIMNKNSGNSHKILRKRHEDINCEKDLCRVQCKKCNVGDLTCQI